MSNGKRLSLQFHDFVERPDIDNFLYEIVEVYRRHGFALGINKAMGPWGEFIVTDDSEASIEWLQRACIGIDAENRDVTDDNHVVPDLKTFLAMRNNQKRGK